MPPPKRDWLLIADILVATVLIGGGWFAGPTLASACERVGFRWWYLFGPLLFLSIAWRCSRGSAKAQSARANLPRNCVRAESVRGELYVLGTMHVAPRSPLDVAQAARELDPDAYLIELDQQRLRDLRRMESDTPGPQWPLQQCRVSTPDGASFELSGIATEWNGVARGREVSGALAWAHDGDLDGKVAVVNASSAIPRQVAESGRRPSGAAS